MSFPFLFADSFEVGSFTNWDVSEVDTGSRLDAVHYSTLAGAPGTAAPFRGAYCMRIQLGDTNDHTIGDGDMNIADTATAWLRFYLYISNDFAATSDDIFNIFEWQESGNVVEAVISLQITSATNLVEIGIADGTEASTFGGTLSKGVWHVIEAMNNTETNATGVLDLYVDGTRLQNLTSIDSSAAITHGILGTQNTLSTTTGTLLFDQFIFDDLQVYPIRQRFPQSVHMTESGHAFVGQGVIENVTLVSSANTDNTLRVYDTDRATVTGESNRVVSLANTANNEIVDPAGMPITVQRGAYIELGGTDPQAQVLIGYAQGYYSDAAIRKIGVDTARHSTV